MKSLQQLLGITLTLLIVVGCDNYKDVDESAALKEELLIGTWKLDFATFESIDVTDQFNDFAAGEFLQLTYNEDGTWQSQNGGVIFESGGNWLFDQSSKDFISMDGVDVLFLLNFDAAVLNISFSASGSSVGGRVEGLSGDYEMSFTRVEAEDE
ncbi:MAG: hypothetical protein KI790_06140 [Cyclobacteriaceae bacterium]|nr:hypothetical protein [Cyclobacteriaceae bacterium HetDA_MAG_MS6]